MPRRASVSSSAYDAKHSIKAEGNKKAMLILGADDFPFPIPLVNNRSGWEFDTAAGRLEILYRRIGRNELDAIQTCLAFVDAQNEYAEKDRTARGGRLRTTHRQQPGQEGRAVLARRSRPESARRIGGASVGRRVQGRRAGQRPITDTISEF